MKQPTRRAFIAGTVGAASLLVLGGAGSALGRGETILRPPGAQDANRFDALCVKCDRCRSACPHGCIALCTLDQGFLDARTPRLDFQRGYCSFCDACADVCPTGAIASGFEEDVEKIGVAVVDEARCLAFNGGGCERCADSCPYDAVDFSKTYPVVDADSCNGCGMCTYVCPSNSLRSFTGSRDTRGINVVVESEVRT